MDEDLSLQQQMVIALNVCRQVKELINEILDQSPISEMSEARLDILSRALDNQTLAWQKLGELMHSYAIEHDYNVELL